MQLWCKFRNALFTETGYSLSCPELRKDTDLYVRTLDENGLGASLDLLACTNDAMAQATVLTIRAYPNPTKAADALSVMCAYAGLAREGDGEARELVAHAWKCMLLDGLMLTAQDQKTQVDILNNIFGSGRVLKQLNKHNSIKFLAQDADWDLMLSEALSAA